MKTYSMFNRFVAVVLIASFLGCTLFLDKAVADDVIVSDTSTMNKDGGTITPNSSVGCVVGVIVLVGGAYVIIKLWSFCNTHLPPTPPPPPPPPGTNNTAAAYFPSYLPTTSVSSSIYLFQNSYDESEAVVVASSELYGGYDRFVGAPFDIECVTIETSSGPQVTLKAHQIDMVAMVLQTNVFDGTGIDPYNDTYFTSNGMRILSSESKISLVDNVVTVVNGSSNIVRQVNIQMSTDLVNWQNVVSIASQYATNRITGNSRSCDMFFRAVLDP